MSRIPKWKGEKSKSKLVFRLQFEATHIPQPGWDKLFISFISAETGKVTAKTTKANVRNGCCKWSDPIYETTRLSYDTQTKKYDEKLYKIVIAMGTTRSSLLGEVNINLSEFVDALKPSSISVPLEACDFRTILHVTVQLLTSKTGFREFEQQREVKQKLHIIPDSYNCESGEKIKPSSEAAFATINKEDRGMSYKQHLTDCQTFKKVVGSSEECKDLVVGIDGSSCTSESAYSDKCDIIIPPKLGNISKVSKTDDNSHISHIVYPVKDIQDVYLPLGCGSNDLTHGWCSDYSIDNDLTITSDDNDRRRIRLKATEAFISEYKMEVSSFQTVADELRKETKSIVHQLVGEITSSEALVTEVGLLKSEFMKLKNDIEELKNCKDMLLLADGRNHLSDIGILKTMLENEQIKTELLKDSFDSSHGQGTNVQSDSCQLQIFLLKWKQGLALIENKVNDIRNKTQQLYCGTDDDILNDDFQILNCVLKNLKGLSNLSRSPELLKRTIVIENQWVNLLTIPGSGLQRESEKFVKERDYELMRELEVSKLEQENLTRKMNQMENYYETFIQELEDNHKNALNELEILKAEHSTCFYTVSAFQVEIEKMRQEMNGQCSRFSDERHSLNFLNKELERRANASETILKRIRQNYSVAIGRLQKDLELLSGQVLSLFETNENLARQTFAEASQLLLYEFPNEHSGVGQLDLDKAASQTILHNRYLNEYSKGTHSIENLSELNGASLQHGSLKSHHFSIAEETKNNVSLHAKVQVSKDDESPSSNDHKLEKHVSTIPSQNKNKCSGTDLVRTADLTEENILATDIGIIPRLQEPDTCSQLTVEKNTSACMQLINEKLTLEHDKESIQRHYRSKGAEVECANIHTEIVHLELFIKVLQETLHEKVLDIRRLKTDFDELTRQLDYSTQSNEQLMTKLHIMSDKCRILRESEEKYITTCDDLGLTNNLLETKLQDLLDENARLSEKLATGQWTPTESNLENRHIICEAEKKELELLLKQETVQKTCLTTELNSIVEECKSLKEESAKISKRSDDLSLQNHTMEARMQDILTENALLTEKLADCQKYTMEYKDFENKYRVCNAQKVDLERLFEQEAAQKASVQGELKAIMTEYTTLKSESDSKSVVIDNLEKTVYFVNEKLGALWSRIASCDNQISDSEFSSFSLGQELENGNHMAIMTHMEKCLQGVNNKILQLVLENKSLGEKAETTQGMLNSLDINLQDCRKKLEVSNANAQKLQQELEAVCKNLKVTSESKDMHEQRHIELLQKNTVMEHDLEHAKSENKVLAQKLLDVNSLKEELVLTKLKATNCIHEKELMMLEVESGNRALTQLEKTIFGLKERLIFADDEIQSGKVTSEKLQQTIFELKLQLKEKTDQLLLFDAQQAEIAHLRLQTSERESCNFQLQHNLLQSEECRMKLNDEVLFLHVQVSDLEKTVNFVNEKLQDICSSIGYNVNHISPVNCASEKVESDNKRYTVLTMQVKQNLEEATKKILEQIHENKEIKEQRDILQTLLNNTMSNLHDYIEKLDLSNARLAELHREVEDVKEKLKIKSGDSGGGNTHAQRYIELATKFTILNYEWQLTKHENKDMAKKLLEFEKIEEELETVKFSLVQSMHENETLLISLESANKISIQMKNELFTLKNKLISADSKLEVAEIVREQLDCKISELEFQLQEKQDVLSLFEVQNSEIASLRMQLSELESQKSGLEYLLLQNNELCRELNDEKISFQDRIFKLESEVSSLKGSLEHLQDSERASQKDLEYRVSDLKRQVNEKSEQLLLFDEQKTELAQLKQCIDELESEISPLNHLLSQSEECRRDLGLKISSHFSHVTELQNELESIKETLKCLSSDLQYERGQNNSLDLMVRNLRCQLENRNEQIILFAKEKTNFDNVRFQISKLEEENSKLHNLLLQEKNSQKNLNDRKSFLQMQAADLESQISMLYECSLADSLKVIFLSNQFQLAVDQINNMNLSVDKIEKEVVRTEEFEAIGLDEKNQYRIDEYIDKNTNVFSLTGKSENDSQSVDMSDYSENKKERERDKLSRMIPSFEEEIDNLLSSREELSVIVLVLLSKYNEQKMKMSSMEEYDTALVKLQGEYNELNYRLSEQILKTEEFKNLSLHFKELKDRADADVMLIREKKETQGGANSIQESLRMAFIKEQYESEIQELRKQLDISKMHADELLFKLQSTLDEMELRKKNEISHYKRNDELTKKVSELEAELKAVVIDKRELVKVYDEIKTELECSSISLDCCKEEKIRIERQLHESNEERSKSRVELDLMKRRMQILISTADCLDQGSQPNLCMTSFGQILEEVGSDVLSHVPATSNTRGASPAGDTSAVLGSLTAQELDNLNSMKTSCSKNDQSTSSNTFGDICKEVDLPQEGILDNNQEVERLGLKRGRSHEENVDIQEQTNERKILESRLASIHSELETLKNENLAAVFSSDAPLVDSELKCVEKDLVHLNMTNERLENMFNSVKLMSGTKNSLESVLTLELELAQALQEKKKRVSRLQSLPLIEHDEGESIFHAFRNINELIKDMLQIKGKYVAVEGELKEMHNRYSDLSLQLAEVEGERQKLVMTLKNRGPRKQKSISPTNSPSENK